MTQQEIVKQLQDQLGNKILSTIPFPEPYCENPDKIKAIYLGCDPSNKYTHKLPFAFALKSGEPIFKSFISFHTNNLKEVGLTWDDLYVQNLCRNYFYADTSQNLETWKKATLFWIPRLKDELSCFDPDIPVLLTSQYLYEVLVNGEWQHYIAPDFYTCQVPIPIPPENNALERPLIPFYRGKSPRYNVSYHLKNPPWNLYKTRIRNILQT